MCPRVSAIAPMAQPRSIVARCFLQQVFVATSRNGPTESGSTCRSYEIPLRRAEFGPIRDLTDRLAARPNVRVQQPVEAPVVPIVRARHTIGRRRFGAASGCSSLHRVDSNLPIAGGAPNSALFLMANDVDLELHRAHHKGVVG